MMLRLASAACLAALAALPCGCGRKADPSRHLEAAERHLAAGDLASAEIEFKNALQAEPDNARGLAGSGALWLQRGAALQAAGFYARASERAPDDPAVRTGFARALMVLGCLGDARQQAAAALKIAPDDGEALVVLAETARTPEMIAETRELLARLARPDDATPLTAAALLAIREGKPDEAAEALRKAIAADPRAARPHMLMAQLEWSRQRTAEAEAEFRAARELAPPRSSESTGLALFLGQTGRRAEAAGLLREQTAATPDFLPAWRLLGRLCWEDKDRAGALAAAGRALALVPHDLDASLLRAEIHVADGEAGKAMDMLERVRDAYPPNPMIELQLGRTCIAARKPGPAAAALDRALELAPGLPDALVLRATLKLAEGDAAGVIAEMQAVVQQHPGHQAGRLLLIDALRAAGRLDEAAELLGGMAAAAPADFRPHYHLGATLLRQGKLAEARAAFEKAQELAPDNLSVAGQLIAIDLAEKDPDGARRRIDAQLARQPQSAQAHYLSGLVYEARKMPGLAEEGLRKAVELDPGMLAAYAALIRLQLAAGRSEEAVGELRRVIEKSPGNVVALMQLGLLEQALGRRTEAAAAFQQILDSKPDFVPALNNLAVIRSESPDQLAKARELATRARTLAPDDGSVADTLGWIQFLGGDFAQARATLQQAADRLPDHPVVQFHLGMAASVHGDLAVARDAFAKAAASSATFPEKPEAAKQLARLEEDAGPPPADEAAIAALEARLRDDPRDVIGRLRLARALAAAGKSQPAADTFQQALAINPDLAAAHLGLAELFAGPLNDPARATAAAEKARALDPNEPRVAMLLGRAALRAGDPGRAHSLLEQATADPARPADPAALRDLARAAYALGRMESARATMERAAAAAGGDQAIVLETRRFLDLTAPGLLDSADAAARIDAARQAEPDDLAVLMAAGRFAARGGARSEAVAAFRRALKLSPSFAPARCELAAVLVDDPATLAEAAKLALAAREVLADDPDLTGVLGRVNFRQGSFDDAAQLLGELATRRALTPAESFALGISLVESGRGAEARPALERALAAGLPDADAARAKAALEDPSLK